MTPREAVVLALWRLRRHRPRPEREPTVPYERLRDAIPPDIGTDDELREVLADLVRDGSVVTRDDGWQVQPDQAPRIRALAREVDQAQFGEWMVAGEASPANRAFCDATNGTGLVHFGMLCPAQLDALIEALDLQPGQRALDLGCGVGTVTEHLARVTGARIHGVDFARAAIERARARAEPGDPTYEVADLDDLVPEPGARDVIFALDTLYFVDDLPRLVRACLAGLAPGGRLVAFYTAKIAEGWPPQRMSPEGSPLGIALAEAGASFTTREHTAEERAYWERCERALEPTRAAFEAEGSLDLWEARRRETAVILERFRLDRCRRFLYVAVP